MEKDFKKINVLSYEDAIKDLIVSGMTYEEAEECLDKVSKENDIAQQATYSYVFFEELSKREQDEIKPYFENLDDISTFNLAKYLSNIFKDKKELNLGLLKYCISYKIGFDSKIDNGFSPIHIASYYNNYEIAKLLIEKGADVNYIINNDDINYTPLKCVFLSGKSSYKIVKLLIDNGADVSIFNNEKLKKLAIDKVCKNNDLELLNLLIENGVKRISINNLCDACENLNFEMIKILIENGVDINDEDFIGRRPIVIISSSHFHSVHQSEDSELQYDILKYLIDHGANIDMNEALFEFCKVSRYLDINPKVIKLFIDNGVDINCKNRYDETLLMVVCDGKFNSYELAKILIENGADINYKDKNGNTVLMYLNENEINESDYYSMIYSKIEDDLGGDVEKFMVALNSDKILEMLIKKDININSKNNIGMTPLMKYSLGAKDYLVKILLENGADINLKSEMTAFDLAQNDEIKSLIQKSKNNNPQKLVKLLTNFTIDKPIKYTTHTWDFGELKKEYGDFDGYMNAVKIQFDSMKNELEELSPNLYKKIYTFLIEENLNEKYSWCSKTNINIGWSNLDGLREHCDSGNNPFDFKLPKPFMIPPRRQISTFGEVINLFKQEIEIRTDFKNLEIIFNEEKNKMNADFKLDLSTAKLLRQFYTDTQKFTFALNKIFDEIKKRKEYPNIEVTSLELDDRSIEIKITQIDSISSRSADELLQRSKQSGDLSDIVENLKNLCDYSIEASYENNNFRANFLHSNNVKDIEVFEKKSSGFTHILRFYK